MLNERFDNRQSSFPASEIKIDLAPLAAPPAASYINDLSSAPPLSSKESRMGGGGGGTGDTATGSSTSNGTPAWNPSVQYTWNSPGPFQNSGSGSGMTTPGTAAPGSGTDQTGATTGGSPTDASSQTQAAGLDGGLGSMQSEINQILGPKDNLLGEAGVSAGSAFAGSAYSFFRSNQFGFGQGVKYTAIGTGLAVGERFGLYWLMSSHLQNHPLLQTIAAPNWIDSITMALPWSFENNKLKAGIIAGGFLLARGWNLASDIIHGDPRTTNDNALNALVADAHDRSAGSFSNAQSLFEKLASDNEPVVRNYYLTWTQAGKQFQDPLAAARGAAILSAAWGNAILQMGTIEPNTGTPQYILGGKDLDLGAHALTALIQAKTYIEEAKKLTSQKIGKQDNGTIVQQSEIAGLDAEEKAIDATINDKIYAAHDIPGSITELQTYFKDNEGSATRLLTDIENTITASANSSDKQYQAKLYRDFALISVAFAEFNLHSNASDAYIALNGSPQYQANGSGVPNGAMQALAIAQKLDPQNGDLNQLIPIAYSLDKQLPASVKQQQSSTVVNPFQVQTQPSG